MQSKQNQTTMNVFKNLTVSTSFTSTTLETVLEAIKTGELNLTSGYNRSVATGALNASKEDKYSTEDYLGGKNKYNYLKVNSVMTWCPNASFNNNHRKTSNLKELTGYVYCDIDGIDPKEAKQLVSTLPFVYAAWASLSGTGIGFLVKANWGVDNFKSNYAALSKYFLDTHNIELDKTSDFTRTNVFSYDPNIYINSKASNIDSETLSPFMVVRTNPYIKKASTAKLEANTDLQELIESLEIEIDYKSKVKIALNHAEKVMGEYADGNKYNYLTSFVGTCTTIGIPFDIMVEEFEAYADELCMETFEDVMYKLYNDFEGNGEGNNITASNLTAYVTNTLNVKSTVQLSGRYLDNQIPTEFNTNTLLVSPTGSGKSTYVMESLKGKRIVVTPNTAILKNFKIFKGTSVFYGDEKSTDFTDIIITTQDSFANLVSTLTDRGESLLDYTVVIDEFHTLVTSADYGYKYKAINSTVDLLKVNPVRVLGLTATPITTVTNSELYASFETLLVKQKDDVKREIQLTEYDDYRSYVIERAMENYKSKTITVVYRNSKRNIEVLAEALRMQGLTTAIINADTKDTEEYQRLIEKGQLDVDVILTTCIMKEGVSVKSKKDDVSVDYIITGDTHYSEINQITSRVRNATSITVSLASSKKSFKNYTLPFFFDKVVQEIDAANTFLLGRLNTEDYTETEIKLDQRLIGSSLRYNQDTQKFEVDAIYKDYLIYEAEKKVCTINPLYTIVRLLEDERFTVFGSVLEYTEDNKACIEAAKEEVKKTEVESKIDFKALVDEVNEDTVEDKLDYIKEHGTKEEQSMAFYTRFVYTRMKKKNLYIAIDKATEFYDSKRKFKDFKIQLEISGLFNSETKDVSISSKFFKTLKKKIKLNKEYTSKQIHDIFTQVASSSDAEEFIKITKTKSTQWFKLLGACTDKTTKDKNRKSMRVFTLSAWGLSNFNYEPTYTQREINTNKVVILPSTNYTKPVNPYLGK